MWRNCTYSGRERSGAGWPVWCARSPGRSRTEAAARRTQKRSRPAMIRPLQALTLAWPLLLFRRELPNTRTSGEWLGGLFKPGPQSDKNRQGIKNPVSRPTAKRIELPRWSKRASDFRPFPSSLTKESRADDRQGRIRDRQRRWNAAGAEGRPERQRPCERNLPHPEDEHVDERRRPRVAGAVERLRQHHPVRIEQEPQADDAQAGGAKRLRQDVGGEDSDDSLR